MLNIYTTLDPLSQKKSQQSMKGVCPNVEYQVEWLHIQ